MRKQWNSLIVLALSTLMLLSSIGLTGGIVNSKPGPEPLAEPVPNSPMLFDPWPTFTGATVYHSWEEMVIEMEQTAADHPDITRMVSIGKTWQGRDIWAMKISDNPELEEPDEPELLFTGNHHAREWLTIEINLYAIAFFTDNYGINATVTDIVDNRQLWIIPVINPDGRVIDSPGDDPTTHTAQPYGWRKNARDNNGDMVFNEADDGVDLNRNYDYLWGASGATSDPTEYTYGGPYGFSEPETQAIRDFSMDHDFVFASNYHTYSQLILYPWGWTYEDTQDHDLFVSVAWELEARITNLAGSSNDGYVPKQSADLYPTSGGSDDWMYGNMGTLAYTIEAYPFYDWDGGTGAESDQAIEDPYDLFHPREDKVLPVSQDNIHAFVYLSQIADNPFQVMDHVEMEAANHELVIKDGSTGNITLNITNNGQRDDAFDMSSSTIPGWTITNTPGTHNLPINETGQSTLEVTVPSGETPGTYSIAAYVTSQTNASCNDSVVVTIIVPYPEDASTIEIQPFIEQATYPGGNYRITGTVENAGDVQLPEFNTTLTIREMGASGLVTLFSDDMESGMTNWNYEDWDGTVTSDYWRDVTSQSNSGASSMYCGNTAGNGYSNEANQFIEMIPSVSLRNATSATLSYYTYFSTQADWDFSVILASGDGGQTWDHLGRYHGSSTSWQLRTIDISNYTGSEDFKIKFWFTSNGATTSQGFWFDDIQISAMLPDENIIWGPTPLSTNGSLDSLQTQNLEWYYDFQTSGTYRVTVETQYPTDDYPDNDLKDVIITINTSSILPDFAGVGAVNNSGTGDQLNISWQPANDPNAPILYSLWRFDHLPDEVEVNSTTPTWVGNSLFHNDAGLMPGQTYYYVVRAQDDLGQQDWNMVVKNGTPTEIIYFQVQSPFAGYKNISKETFESSIQISASPVLSAPNNYRIGGLDDHWLSEARAEDLDMGGIWYFSIWGGMNVDRATGQLFARVYRYSDDSVLFETGPDDENIGNYTGQYHQFSWEYTVSGVLLPANDRYYVELWLNVSAVSPSPVPIDYDYSTGASIDKWAYEVESNDAPATSINSQNEATSTDYANIASSDDSRWQTIDPGNGDYVSVKSVLWLNETPSLIDSIDLHFEGYSAPAGTLNIYAWNSVSSAWVSVGSGSMGTGSDVHINGTLSGVDMSEYVVGGNNEFIWLAQFMVQDGFFGSTYMLVDYMSATINALTGPPDGQFSFAYDHSSTPSYIGASVSTPSPLIYNISLIGFLPGEWAFVSFPITCSGDPVTILDDAVYGDGNTSWDMIWWYDAGDAVDHWKSYNKNYAGTPDLNIINNTMGLWVHLISNAGDELLSIGIGNQPNTTSIMLQAGWNMVGYPSNTPRQADITLPTEVTKIAIYNSSQPYNIEELPLTSVNMSSNNAYWVYTPVIVQWNIDW